MGFVGLAWLAWLAVWVALARRVKRTMRREGLVSQLLHLGPLAVAAALLFSPDFAGSLLARRVVPQSAAMLLAGAVVTALGLGFCVWARLVLADNWSGTVQVKQAHALVRSGPYRLVRHPIYTGLLTAFLGTGLVIDAWRAVLAWVIVWLSFERKRRTEEAFMQETFGAAYCDYARQVPPLLPRPPMPARLNR